MEIRSFYISSYRYFVPDGTLKHDHFTFLPADILSLMGHGSMADYNWSRRDHILVEPIYSFIFIVP